MTAIFFADCWVQWKMYNFQHVFDYLNFYHADVIKEKGIKHAWAEFAQYYTFENIVENMNQKQICIQDLEREVKGPGSACQGDSGGPLMCGADHNVLTGVTSFGQPYCDGRVPNVYARVSAYRCFIRKHTGIEM